MGTGRLERWKFIIYLLSPIVAVLVYSAPSIHEASLKKTRYIVYTPSELDDQNLRKVLEKRRVEVQSTDSKTRTPEMN